MLSIQPCPKCKKHEYIAVEEGKLPDSLVIHCSNCGFVMELESKLPLNPKEIVEEWNRRAQCTESYEGMNWGDRMCEICHIRPCDPHSKKPLCTECLIKEMKAFRERLEKERRANE